MTNYSRRTAMGRRVAVFASALAALVTAQVAFALPVFPGAVGFGTNTKAGRDAANDAEHIYKVTTLDDSNISNPVVGSLRYGVEKVIGPRVIVFEVSGVIELQKDLIIRPGSGSSEHGFLTIAGQTAPFPGITLKNGGIRILSHDVLIQHIAVRPGKFTTNSAGWELTSINNRRCIHPGGLAANNIVVDHVSCSWSTDEMFTNWPDDSDTGTLTNITFSNNILAYPIQDAGHTDVNGNPIFHGYGMLIGPGSSNVSVVGNVMAFAYTRNPLIRGKTSGAQVVNNFIYHPGAYNNSVINVGTASTGWGNFQMKVSAIGNLAYLMPSVPWNGGTTDAHQEGFAVSSGSTTDLWLHLNGNYTYQPEPAVQGQEFVPLPGSTQYSSPYYIGPIPPPAKQMPADPYANSGGTPWSPILGPPEYLKWKIVPGAGKFSGQRDPIDAALMKKINDPDDNTNPTVNSLWLKKEEDLGPNPWAPVNVNNPRTFTVPNNPTGDSDGDGYTNLEEELHRWSAIVEGRSVAADPAVSKFDTFTDGVADGWTTAVTGTGGNWAVSGQALVQSLTDQNSRALVNGSKWTDQVVEARVDASAFNGTSFVAVYARFNTIDDSYYLTMRSTGAVELKRIKSGVGVTTYASTAAGAYDPLAAHVLRLEVVGNTLRGYVDNTLVVSGTDNEWAFQSGQAGVGAYRASAAFDNVFASPFPPASRVNDDFDDQNATGWSMAETGTSNWSVAPASSGSTNWVLAQTQSTGNYRVSRAVATRDQSTQAKVRFVTASDSRGFIAVYARYQDLNNGYYALLRSSRSLELKKIVGGVASEIATLALPANFDLTAWHTLRLEVRGDKLTTLKAYLDGQLQLVGSDFTNPYTSGAAAFGTYLTSADFDDVVLSQP
jgi:hypothetical protein